MSFSSRLEYLGSIAKPLYDEAVRNAGSGQRPAEFSKTQLLKLERMGLLNASREQQLEALFPDDDSPQSTGDRIEDMTPEQFAEFLRTGQLPE